MLNSKTSNVSRVSLAAGSNMSTNQNYHSVPSYGYRQQVVPLSRYQPFGRSYSQHERYGVQKVPQRRASVGFYSYRDGEYDHQNRWYPYKVSSRTQYPQQQHQISQQHHQQQQQQQQQQQYRSQERQPISRGSYYYRPKKRSHSAPKDLDYIHSPTFRHVPTVVETIDRHKTITPNDDENVVYSSYGEESRSVSTSTPSKRRNSASDVIDSLIRKRHSSTTFQPSETNEDGFNESSNAYEMDEEVEQEPESLNRQTDPSECSYSTQYRRSDTCSERHGNRSYNAASDVDCQYQSDIHQHQHADDTETMSTASETLQQRMSNLRAKLAGAEHMSSRKSAFRRKDECTSTDEVLKHSKAWFDDECDSPRKMVRHNRNMNMNRADDSYEDDGLIHDVNMNMNRDEELYSEVVGRSYTTVYRQQSPDTYWKQYMATFIDDNNKNVNENSFELEDDVKPYLTYGDYFKNGKRQIYCDSSSQVETHEFDETDAKPFISINELEDDIVMEERRRSITGENDDGTEDEALTSVWCTTVNVPENENTDYTEEGLEGIWRTTVSVPVENFTEGAEESVNEENMSINATSTADMETESRDNRFVLDMNTGDLSPFHNETYCSSDSAKRKYVRSFEDCGKKLYYVSTEDLLNAADMDTVEADIGEEDDDIDDSKDDGTDENEERSNGDDDHSNGEKEQSDDDDEQEEDQAISSKTTTDDERLVENCSKTSTDGDDEYYKDENIEDDNLSENNNEIDEQETSTVSKLVNDLAYDEETLLETSFSKPYHLKSPVVIDMADLSCGEIKSPICPQSTSCIDDIATDDGKEVYTEPPFVIDMAVDEDDKPPSFLEPHDCSADSDLNGSMEQPSFLTSQAKDEDNIEGIADESIDTENDQTTICQSPPPDCVSEFGEADDFNMTDSSTTTSGTLVGTVGERTLDSLTDDTLVEESELNSD